MKKIWCALLLLVVCVGFTEPPQIQYDGVYACKGNGYVSYLRFYESGDVLKASSTGNVEDLKNWMCLDTFMLHDWHSRGGFRIKENSAISFATTSSAGTVEYSGVIENDSTLHLFEHSLINDHRSEKTYHYIPVEEWKKK